MLTLLSVVVPTNIFVYATSDTTYVEKVSSMVDIEETEHNNKESKEKQNENVNTNIANVLGLQTNNNSTYSLVFGEELSAFDIVYKSTVSENELNTKFVELNEVTLDNLNNYSVIEIEEPKEEPKKTEEKSDKDKKKQKETKKEKPEPAKIISVDQTSSMLQISNPDPNYTGSIVVLSPQDRDLLERLVQGEAGGEGVEGAALVAQAIRDTMVYKGFNSVEAVRQALRYSGDISKQPNENVKQAVAYVFDQGGIVVKHKVFYFYAYGKCRSSWHESQTFVIQHGGHRFFGN